MQWSKLKKQIESRLCNALKSRITYHNTRYRDTHDQVGRGWVTFDNEIIHDFCTVNRGYQYNSLANDIRKQNDALDWRNPEQQDEYYKAYKIAEREMEKQGIHNQYEFYNAIEEFINLSIDDALSSTNPLIRAIAYFDSRLGKRRLVKLKEDESIIARKFQVVRLKAGGIFDRRGNID